MTDLAAVHRGAGDPQSGIAWLRERVFAHRRACDLNPRIYREGQWQDLHVEMRLWWSQANLMGHGVLFRPLEGGSRKLPVTLAIWDGGSSSLCAHASVIRRTCDSGRALLVLDVSGVGALHPLPIMGGDDLEFYGVLHKLATDLIWLDDDLAALRTFDALRSLDALAAWPGIDDGDIRVYADGRHGLYGRLAAMLDPRVLSVEYGPNQESYSDWVCARHYDSRDIYSVILRGAAERLDL